MARYISFAVLLGIIVVIGALFYKVMIGFFVPVFLAAVLVVVFRPLHRWVNSKVGERDHLAAGITTTLILLIVLIPAGLVLSMAAIQGAGMVRGLNLSGTGIAVGLEKLRRNKWLNLEFPHADLVRGIQAKVDEIQAEVASDRSFDELTSPTGRVVGDIREIQRLSRDVIPKFFDATQRTVERELVEEKRYTRQEDAVRLQKELDALFQSIRAQVNELIAMQSQSLQSQENATTKEEATALQKSFDQKVDEVRGSFRISEARFTADDVAVLTATRSKLIQDSLLWNQSLTNFDQSLDRFTKSIASSTPIEEKQIHDIVELQKEIIQLSQQWNDTRRTLSGGEWIGILKEWANPSREQTANMTASIIDYIRPRLLSFGGDSAAFLLRLAISASILLVSLYFFLCDGPAMVHSIMELSPLDDRYELELLGEFDRISRAIVLATVLSALFQGVTAGLGYWFVGMSSLVLLIALTCTCALIPFVGPAIVWVPVCVYLAIWEERFGAAIGLALWGVLVVASIDNVVKMLVLHGQSQLHPLLALLSVLGGIQALGPIGILIGPMVVVLLQTLLGILRHELTKFKKNDDDVTASDIRDLSGFIRKTKGKGSKASENQPASTPGAEEGGSPRLSPNG